MLKENFDKAQGHWILARMGKKVLRPGGKELTMKLVNALHIKPTDDVVEFAPGLGYTTSLTLANHPNSYVGVDADEDAVKLLRKKFRKANVQFELGNAASTKQNDQSKDKVYGEAMLTMHADHRKSEIIKEAHRILKRGGTYAIHELGLTPNELNESDKAEVQRDLALAIKVNARPLTESEWCQLLEKEGFKIIDVCTNDMHLLRPKRMIEDEGFFRALKIGLNIITHPKARKRIMAMRKVFQKHQFKMNAIMVTAEKL